MIITAIIKDGHVTARDRYGNTYRPKVTRTEKGIAIQWIKEHNNEKNK